MHNQAHMHQMIYCEAVAAEASFTRDCAQVYSDTNFGGSISDGSKTGIALSISSAEKGMLHIHTKLYINLYDVDNLSYL